MARAKTKAEELQEAFVAEFGEQAKVGRTGELLGFKQPKQAQPETDSDKE